MNKIENKNKNLVLPFCFGVGDSHMNPLLVSVSRNNFCFYSLKSQIRNLAQNQRTQVTQAHTQANENKTVFRFQRFLRGQLVPCS